MAHVGDSLPFGVGSRAYESWIIQFKLWDPYPDEVQPGVVSDYELFDRNARPAEEVVEINNGRPRIGPGFYDQGLLEIWNAACDPLLVSLVQRMPDSVALRGRKNPEIWREWARQQPLWEEAMRRRRKAHKRHTNSKDLQKLVRKAVSQGATVEAGGKHLSLVGANGERVPISGSPSDHHSVRNAERQMVQKGILNPEQEEQKMAPPGSYTLVKWPDQDRDRLRAVLLELGYDRDQWAGKKGRGPGGLLRFLEHTMAVAEQEGIRRWDNVKAGSHAVRHALEGGQTADWTHHLLMTGVATMEELLTEPTPQDEEQADVVAEVGPLYGDGPKFSCDECDMTFDRAASLGAHKWRTHGRAGESASSKRRSLEKREEEKVEETEPGTEQQPVQDQWASAAPLELQSKNGRIEFDADSLHLRVLRALLTQSDPDEAFALAAEVANLELRAHT